MRMYNIVCYMQCNIRIIHRMKMQIKDYSFSILLNKQDLKDQFFFSSSCYKLCHVNFQFRAVSGFPLGLQRIPNFYLRWFCNFKIMWVLVLRLSESM